MSYLKSKGEFFGGIYCQKEVDFLQVPIGLMIETENRNMYRNLVFLLKMKFLFRDGNFPRKLIYGYHYDNQIHLRLGFKSIKAVRKNLEELINCDWISYNDKDNRFYIRSFDRLLIKYNITMQQSFRFYKEHINYPKAILGHVIFYLSWKTIKYELVGKSNLLKIKTGQLELIMRSSNLRRCPSLLQHCENGFLPISSEYVKKKFRIEISKIKRAKKLALERRLMLREETELRSDFLLKSHPKWRWSHDLQNLQGTFRNVRGTDLIKPNEIHIVRRKIHQRNKRHITRKYKDELQYQKNLKEFRKKRLKDC